MRHSGLIFIQIVFYLEFKFLKTNFLKRNPWYDLLFTTFVMEIRLKG
mgnify:CR=1 FL=1